MKTYKMQLQNKPIQEISSKSDNGKVVKYNNMGKISQGRGGKFGGQISKKKIKTYKRRLQNKPIGTRNFIQIGQWESGQI